MARPKKTVDAPEEITDHSVLLYQDRSGPPRTIQLSEGKDNFSAITKAAQEPEPVVPQFPFIPPGT